MLSNPGSLSKPWVIITEVTNPANHYYVTHSIIYVTTTHRSELTAILTVVAVYVYIVEPVSDSHLWANYIAYLSREVSALQR